MLLHNGKMYSSLPLAHLEYFKKKSSIVKILLKSLKYQEYGWEVIGDFIIVTILLGLQGRFSKFPCYICLRNSRATAEHCQMRDWSQWTEFSVGEKNIKLEPLLDPRKVLFPSLHMKNGSCQTVSSDCRLVVYSLQISCRLSLKLSEAKVKASVFLEPQIKIILHCKKFPEKLTETEESVRNSFVAVIQGFLRIHKDVNNADLVEMLVKNDSKLGCSMSLKVHILDAHLDKVTNMGTFSKDQCERFHQGIMDFEHRYQGSYNENAIEDYIWSLNLQYMRKLIVDNLWYLYCSPRINKYHFLITCHFDSTLNICRFSQ